MADEETGPAMLHIGNQQESVDVIVTDIMEEVVKHLPTCTDPTAPEGHMIKFEAGVDVRDVTEMVMGLTAMRVLEMMRKNHEQAMADLEGQLP